MDFPSKANQEKARQQRSSEDPFDLPSGGGWAATAVVAPRGRVAWSQVPALAMARPLAIATHVHRRLFSGSGFGDADVPAPPSARSYAAPTAAPGVPAEIISKPTPVYTQEARNLRIEGEVLLETLKLQALWQPARVTHMVRGIGSRPLTTTRSRQPSRFGLSRRQRMANQWIPPSFCTLFFSWRRVKGFLCVICNYSGFAFAVVRVGIVVPRPFAELHIFGAPGLGQQRSQSKWDYARPASRVFQ